MTVRVVQALVVAAALTVAALMWRDTQSVAGTDSVGYITSGVNLFKEGRYTNRFGEAETWFPPLYPALVGAASLAGRLDAVVAARVVSLLAALITVWLVVSLSSRLTPPPVVAGLAAGLFLVFNATFQTAAVAALSESVATMLAVAAFVLWHGLEAPSARRSLAIGALVGAATLTRPEAILLLPCWIVIDLVLVGWTNRRTAMVLAVAATVLVMAPHVVWLSAATGRLTFTGKTAVNLASGRATYYGIPRERVEPVSHELEYSPFTVTTESEARRYAFNWMRIAGRYRRIFDGPSGIAILVLIGWGAFALVTEGRRRTLAGLAAFFAYLPVMAVFEVKDRYFLSTLPPLAVLFGVGCVGAAQAIAGKTRSAVVRFVAALLVAGAAVGLIEHGLDRPRTALGRARPPVSLLKDAGLRVATLGGTSPVYENWSLVGFYSGRLTRQLTSDPLPLLLAHMRKLEGPGGHPLLVVCSLDLTHYDPSVSALKANLPAGFSRVAELSDERGWVVVIEVDLDAARMPPPLAQRAPRERVGSPPATSQLGRGERANVYDRRW